MPTGKKLASKTNAMDITIFIYISVLFVVVRNEENYIAKKIIARTIEHQLFSVMPEHQH